MGLNLVSFQKPKETKFQTLNKPKRNRLIITYYFMVSPFKSVASSGVSGKVELLKPETSNCSRDPAGEAIADSILSEFVANRLFCSLFCVPFFSHFLPLVLEFGFVESLFLWISGTLLDLVMGEK